MADVGIKISRKGADVDTAAPSDLIYSSKWTNFKIATRLRTQLTVPAGGAAGVFTATIANPYPYRPMYLPFLRDLSDPDAWQPASLGDASGTVFIANSLLLMPNCLLDGANNFVCTVASTGFEPFDITVEFVIVVFADDPGGAANYDFPAIDDYGIKVSKEGFDVNSANDTNLSMSSKFQNLTVATSGIYTVNGPAPSISHNLGYAPIYLLLVEDPDTSGKWRYMPTVLAPAAGGVVHAWAHTDNDDIWLQPQSMYLVHNFRFKYIIFNERINL